MSEQLNSRAIIEFAEHMASQDPRVAVKVAQTVKIIGEVAPLLSAREVRLLTIAAQVTIANEVLRKQHDLSVRTTVNET